jgi:hypothetical protein
MRTTEQVVKNHLRSTFDKLGAGAGSNSMPVAGNGGKTWIEEAMNSAYPCWNPAGCA